MFAYVKTSGDDARDRRRFYCAACGAFIAESGALLALNQATEHTYVNPAGVRCHFMTVERCENVLVGHELYLEHSWFHGYGWRFLVCGRCYQHLGWKYDAVDDSVIPADFFGVLVRTVRSVQEEA